MAPDEGYWGLQDGGQAKTAIFVSAGQVRPMIELAAARGLRTEHLLEMLDLPPDLFAGPDNAKIALVDYYRIRNYIASTLEDETCQLSARQLLPGTTDFIMAQVKDVKSLHEAMRIFAHTYNVIHGGEYNKVRRRGRAVQFVTDDREFPYTLKGSIEHTHFFMECIQIFLHCMLSTVAPQAAPSALRRVAVTRPQNEPGSDHLAFWAAHIRFGSEQYILDYDAEIVDAPIEIPSTDQLTSARVYAKISEMAGAGHQPLRLRQAEFFVKDALAKGVIDQTRIAALAGVSVATLRRRLEVEGVSFRELRREVLNDAAKALLRRRMSVAEVAEELGFSDFRAFNRAFKSWNGVSPKIYAGRSPNSDRLSEKDH